MRSDYPKAAQAKPKDNKSALTIKGAYANLRAWLSNKTKGLKTTMKNTKTNEAAAPKTKAAKNTKGMRNAIIGLLLLMVVTSIAYSSYVVWFGTTGVVPKIMLAPQMIFAAAVLIWKFNK